MQRARYVLELNEKFASTCHFEAFEAFEAFGAPPGPGRCK